MNATSEQLDRMGCGSPRCTHNHDVLYLHSNCHPECDLEVAYHKATHQLLVMCSFCKKKVLAVEVV